MIPNINFDPNLCNYTRQELEQLFVHLGEKPFRASQVIKWIHQHQVTDFSQMTNLSLKFREILQNNFTVTLPQLTHEQIANDGTRKWLVHLADGADVETVYIPEANRGTLCISSQVGCPLGCIFCATGKIGFKRNLSTAEIIGQLWLVKAKLATLNLDDKAKTSSELKELPRVSNVVLMGMGEPLLNFANVVKALDLMMDDLAYGLSKYRVTLSTSGIVPEMAKLSTVSEVSLAVSLHAPNDELRNQLMPINKKYPLKELIAVCDNYFQDERRKVTIEYVMLAGINDSPTHAKQLVKLLSNGRYKINLIVFNPVSNAKFQPTSREAVDRFRDILMTAGYNTITRKTRGSDIAAACGQLAGKNRNKLLD